MGESIPEMFENIFQMLDFLENGCIRKGLILLQKLDKGKFKTFYKNYNFRNS